MVEKQLRQRGVTDPRVLEAMGRVPRHRFVLPAAPSCAYEDRPLPIGYQQTISQPYVVALMTQIVSPRPSERALDVGTGSGYQAALLAGLCQAVYSVEIISPLAESAGKLLQELGYDNVTTRCGDGYRGWPEYAPFDAIIVAACADHIPPPLIEQLAPGGRLVIPVGGRPQRLILVTKGPEGVCQRQIAPVAFVPMTGEVTQKKT